MKYDFDKIIDRRNTDSLKYDFAAQRGKPEDILPMLGGGHGFPDAVLRHRGAGG